MKRALSVILALVLVLTCFTAAFAEEKNGAAQGPAGTNASQKAGNAPQGNAPTGNAPTGGPGKAQSARPEGTGSGMTPPANPSDNGTAQQRPEGNTPSAASKPDDEASWNELVKSGTISQQTCDAILAYLKKNAPADMPSGTPDSSANGNQPSGTPNQSADNQPSGAPDQSAAAPEKPEGTPDKPDGQQPSGTPETPANGSKPETNPAFSTELLNDLLQSGILTEAEYNAILALQQTETAAA